MAKLGGLTPLFNTRYIMKYLKEKVDKYNDNIELALIYKGEEFINKARMIDTYKDRTGNLRASIGYMVLKNGKPVKSSFKGGKGGKKAREVAKEIASDYPSGYVLIGVAGMNYAAAVESKGFDVITGSAPESQEIKNLLSGIKF